MSDCPEDALRLKRKKKKNIIIVHFILFYIQIYYAINFGQE